MRHVTVNRSLSTHVIQLCLLITLAACGETKNTPAISASKSEQLSTQASPFSADQLQTARTIHERVLVLDAHTDILLPGTATMYGDPDGSSKVTPEKLAAGGVDAVVMTIAIESGPRTPQGEAQARKTANNELAHVLDIVAEPANNVVIARSAEELEHAHENGQIAILLGFQNARILEKKISAIDEFYNAGVRVFALTHLGHNDFADSSRLAYNFTQQTYETEEEHGGLSELGRSAIARINELGGIVDVTQLSRRATLQSIELSSTPVIASHSNVRAISNATRNLSDKEIDKIGDTGGVIHITAFAGYLVELSSVELIADIKKIRRDAGLAADYIYPFDLSWEIEDPQARGAFFVTMSNRLGTANIDLVIDHIDYVVERIGIDHVGIATDFNHGGGIEGFSNASQALNMTAGLVARGYSAEQIEKIWSGNFLRVLRASEQAATH